MRLLILDTVRCSLCHMEAYSHLDDGVGDEETNYVTLAKAGGRKDLLQHIEYSRPVGQQPVPYPIVDWFAHPSPSHVLPPSSPHLPTLADSILNWPASLVEVKERKRRNRKKDQRRLCKKTSEEITVKLPKVEDAVDMAQLLAMDYQKEWLEEREKRAIEKKRQAKERRAAQRKKLEEHTMRARKVCGVEKSGETQKPRFIMKRFANIPSRVKLPPLNTSPSHT